MSRKREKLLNFTSQVELQLKDKRNLLAFSAGVDSSALFFLLLQHNIAFDIALVNYGIREESKKEELHALALAKKYGIKAHIAHAPTFESNFEKKARDFRYDFFDRLMKNYDNLLTAHQLNDQMEWFLMRLTKGAGLSELIGLEAISTRKDYTMVRPLLKISKKALLNYLKENNLPYFIDKSNSSDHYERNHFRKNFSNQLIEEYEEGIKRSFEYLTKDKAALAQGVEVFFYEKEFYLLGYSHEHQVVRVVDQYLKRLGYLLSAQQRKELEQERSIVFGAIWAVEIVDKRIFIAPYRKGAMPKAFKEACRQAKIPSKVRSYLYEEQIAIKKLLAAFSQ